MIEMNEKKILDIEKANVFLTKKFFSNDPFFVSRIGFAELTHLQAYLRGRYTLKEKMHMYRKNLRYFRSPFKSQKVWKELAPYYLEGYLSGDVQCIWMNYKKKEQMDLLARCDDAVVAIDALGIEPYRALNPWTSALEGKRVLLISPFVRDFQAQYLKRKKIWVGKESVLPDFQIIPYRSEFYFNQSANRIDVLEKMKYDISKLEFDVALISCGSLGLPLGGFIRNDLKKSAVYMGAALQILFGVTGARWESNPYFMELLNDGWIRPSGGKPSGAKLLDNSCYW